MVAGAVSGGYFPEGGAMAASDVKVAGFPVVTPGAAAVHLLQTTGLREIPVDCLTGLSAVRVGGNLHRCRGPEVAPDGTVVPGCGWCGLLGGARHWLLRLPARA